MFHLYFDCNLGFIALFFSPFTCGSYFHTNDGIYVKYLNSVPRNRVLHLCYQQVVKVIPSS